MPKTKTRLVANKVKVKSAHRATPSAVSVVAVAVAVVNALKIPTKQPLRSAMSLAMSVALNARVALMKTAMKPRWSQACKPQSV
jgi:uncharacterized membrane protein